jgi:predicted DNA-binding transcriptional regulator YafY
MLNLWVGHQLSYIEEISLVKVFVQRYCPFMLRQKSRLLPERVSLHSRPPLARMMRVHTLLQSRRYPNCRKLADEFEVSPKTVQRDLDFMRYSMGLPIEYDQMHFGFHYTEPVSSFPNVEITQGELLALYVGQKALAQYKGTSFEAPLARAFQKITDGLRDKVSFSWTELDWAISFRSAGRTVADLHIFEALSNAVLESLEARFEYKKLGARGYEERTVQPYHLGCVENLWYLFGFDLDREQLRTFALPRVRSVKVSKTRFRRPPDFSIGNLLEQSFGVFSKSTNGKIKVRIRFDAFAGQLVQERLWHRSQRLKHLSGGDLELSLTLGNLEEIERWILSWGSHAEVLAPAELRTRLAKTAAVLTKTYGSSGQTP